MSEFLAAVYALISFPYTFSRCKSSSVAQTFTGFSFPSQVFKGRTQVSFVYPTINCFERRHFHPARRFSDLFGRPCLRQLFVYVIQYFLFPKHPAVAVTAAQVTLLLRGMRIVSRYIPEERTVPS